jgi:hypothetical protein
MPFETLDSCCDTWVTEYCRNMNLSGKTALKLVEKEILNFDDGR